MTTLREAAQQALEALEFASLDSFMLAPISPGRESTVKAITALRAALAEPQTTHSADCYKWHHECAVAEVQRLRAALAGFDPLSQAEAERTATTLQHAFARAIERAHGIGGDE